MEQDRPAIASPSLLSRYFSFIRDPRTLNPTLGADQNSAPATPNRLKEIWRLYAVNVVMLLPAMVLILLVVGGAGPIEDKNAIADILQSLSGLKIFLFAVVAAPLLEELMFRLPLQYSPRNLGVPLGILSIYLFNPGVILLGPENFYASMGLNGIFAIAFSSLFTFLFRRFASTQNRRKWFATHRRSLVYSSAILFGLIHIFNYDPSLWRFAPILTLPQLILGFALGYVRLRYGFLWAIAVHAGHNFLATAPSIVMMSLPSELRTALISGETPDSLLWLGGALGLLSLVYFFGGLFLIIRSVRYSIREWRHSRN